MKIIEENPGSEWIVILEMPLAIEDLTEVAGKLPAEATCVHLDYDGGSVYMTWEVSRVVPVD